MRLDGSRKMLGYATTWIGAGPHRGRGVARAARSMRAGLKVRGPSRLRPAVRVEVQPGEARVQHLSGQQTAHQGLRQCARDRPGAPLAPHSRQPSGTVAERPGVRVRGVAVGERLRDRPASATAICNVWHPILDHCGTSSSQSRRGCLSSIVENPSGIRCQTKAIAGQEAYAIGIVDVNAVTRMARVIRVIPVIARIRRTSTASSSSRPTLVSTSTRW